MPDSELIEAEVDLPTGIDNSIASLLPEPIYIPAVKDIGDDIKSKDSATFGKVLLLLLNVIEPQLTDEKEIFESLEKKFNRITSSDGTVKDDRLPEIKEVESLIEKHLKEHFPQATVTMSIPPPNIKMILSSAGIDVHDGAVAGPIETKGDGLKRSVMFAIFRAYVDLARRPGWQKKQVTIGQKPHYLFLFEEPELYLYPKAQRTLFEALAFVSKIHQVVVTTHSPFFFGADSTTTFAKMVKRNSDNEMPKPYTALLPISFISDIPARDIFQIVCFESNNIAFFATDVVLVEGDSDFMSFKHISKCINSGWDFDKGRVMMFRVSGKGNFKRFSEFFKRFDIRVHIISDLDVIVREFDKLGISTGNPVHESRMNLIQEIDQLTGTEVPSTDRIRELFRQTNWRDRFSKFISLAKSMKLGATPSEDDIKMMELMLDEERHQPRIEALKTNATLTEKKRALLRDLRAFNVHVLDKGSIEDYYPVSITGDNKLARAESFSRSVTDRESLMTLCEALSADGSGSLKPEFELIFGSIFGE